MLRYAARRLLESIPLLLAVVVISFLIVHLAPGDPIQALVGEFPAPETYLEQLRRDFGLDQPVYVQLARYIKNVAQGNLGHSFARRRPVRQLIWERVPNTLLLTVTAMTIAAVLGVGLGVYASRRPHGWTDIAISSTSLLGFSIPVFWLGQILIIIFAVQLGWLPAQGMRPVRGAAEGWLGLLQIGTFLVLPAFTLMVRYLAINARITRASMLEVLGKDYITTARAKGVPQLRIVYLHALRNALLPVVTVIGYNFGLVLAGSALVETVFGWPGLGRLLFESLQSRDNPVIIGIFLVVTATAVLANLLTDLLYAILDPRVRYR